MYKKINLISAVISLPLFAGNVLGTSNNSTPTPPVMEEMNEAPTTPVTEEINEVPTTPIMPKREIECPGAPLRPVIHVTEKDISELKRNRPPLFEGDSEISNSITNPKLPELKRENEEQTSNESKRLKIQTVDDTISPIITEENKMPTSEPIVTPTATEINQEQITSPEQVIDLTMTENDSDNDSLVIENNQNTLSTHTEDSGELSDDENSESQEISQISSIDSQAESTQQS